jgi:hypothetical protein
MDQNDGIGHRSGSFAALPLPIMIQSRRWQTRVSKPAIPITAGTAFKKLITSMSH